MKGNSIDLRKPVAKVRIGNVSAIIYDDYSVIPFHFNDRTHDWEVFDGFRYEEISQLVACLQRAQEWVMCHQNRVSG